MVFDLRFCFIGCRIYVIHEGEGIIKFIMSRCFNAVGQGAFYEENFFDSGENIFNFVYDCGTKNNLNLFVPLIQSKKYEKIDLLCISHFDSDHVSLLPELVRDKEVNVLVLPLLSEEEKIYTIIRCISRKPFESPIKLRNLYKLIYNPRDFLNPKKIIYIKGTDTEKSKNPKDTIIEYNLLIEEREKVLDSGDELISPSLFNENWNWIFKPVNLSYPRDENKEKFEEILIKKIKTYPEYEEKYDIIDDAFIKDVIKDKTLINIIREAYHDYFREKGSNPNKLINEYSMILYSGFKRKANIHKNYFRTWCKMNPWMIYSEQINTEKFGCLYLGDFNAKKHFDIIKTYFSKHQDLIHILQVPHHGSVNNWNTKLMDWAEDYIISYGNNPYGHPSIKVILAIEKNHSKNLFEVTHSCNSSVIYEYCYSL